MSRWLLLVACVVACRERTQPAPQSQPAAPASGERAAPVPTPRPALPAIDAPARELSTPAERFAAEPVDAAWHGTEESALRGKLAGALGSPPAVECRRATCQVTVTTTQQDLHAALDALDQLHDAARHVLLTAPATLPDGRVALRAYVRFDRDPID